MVKRQLHHPGRRSSLRYTTMSFPLWHSACSHLVGTGRASRNKLIVFADGTYLELFNWFDKPPDEDAKNQPMRVWARKEPGLIDFALSLRPGSTIESHFDARVARLETAGGDGGLGVTYTPPEAGGRMRKDGVEVKWKVSRPEFRRSVNTPDQSLFPNGRIDAPFFCYDVTSRDVRVPFDDKEKTSHPCGAFRVAAVEILVPKVQIGAYAKLYSSILGLPPEALSGQGRETSFIFQLGLPVDKAEASTVRIRSEQNEADLAWLKERGVGISGIVLTATSGKKYVSEPLGLDTVASTILLERKPE